MGQGREVIDFHVFDGGYVLVAYVTDVWVLVPHLLAHDVDVVAPVAESFVVSAHACGFLREGRAWGGGGASTAWVWW